MELLNERALKSLCELHNNPFVSAETIYPSYESLKYMLLK